MKSTVFTISEPFGKLFVLTHVHGRDKFRSVSLDRLSEKAINKINALGNAGRVIVTK